MSDPTTIEEFKQRWSDEHTEWCAIRDQMIAADTQEKGVTAYDVTAEQRRRQTQRGEVSVMDGVFARRFINRGVERTSL